MKSFSLFLFSILLSLSANARQQVDTLHADLGEVEVTAYESSRSLMEVPASVSFVNAEVINAFDNSSLLFGLNMVPGVRMEQRAPGSYRIAIRGSSLRSPFGIRNVKIYWNGIPFTEPSGNTFLNLLDVINMQQVEVIRGPAGSVYGAGNGGVILIQSELEENKISAGSAFGSYGYRRYSLSASSEYQTGDLLFNFAHQQSDGYREQSFLNRRTAELTGNFRLNERRNVSTSFLYSDLNYGIPGALTFEQMQEDPQQARPGSAFALGSVEANSSIHHQAFLAGLTHEWELTNDIANKSSVFGSFSHFDHPFNLDYKIDSRKSGGIRSVFTFNKNFGEVAASFIAGGEVHSSEYAARNFQNDFGTPGDLNFDDQIGIRSTLVFLTTEMDLPMQFYLSGGISYNRLEYSLNRLESNLAGDMEGLAQKEFEPEIIPRIGLIKKISPAAALYGSLSYGFSPPTIEEFRTNEGSVNVGLEAEQGMNYEMGMRGLLMQGVFQYDLTAFYFQLDESIVQQQSERGTILFENAGNTNQFGFELSTNWMIIRNGQDFLKQLSWQLSYSYNHFRFRNYNRENQDFSGNEISGVVPHSITSLLRTQTNSGIYSTISYNFTDEIPLNDANTVYSNAYHLLQAKIGFQKKIHEVFLLDLFVGADNLLDQQYSLGNDLNAFGGRHYQPAARRNWFGGIILNYEL